MSVSRLNSTTSKQLRKPSKLEPASRCFRSPRCIQGRSVMEPGHFPAKQGLYDPGHEHDACGVGFVVDLKGRASHDLIKKAVEILLNLEHRGACGCEKNTGDGAGVLFQIPD